MMTALERILRKMSRSTLLNVWVQSNGSIGDAAKAELLRREKRERIKMELAKPFERWSFYLWETHLDQGATVYQRYTDPTFGCDR